MRHFQTLFSEKHSNIIEYEGIIYRRFWPVQVNGTIRLKIRILHSSSKFVQAIVFSFPRNFEGIVSVMGNCVPVKKSAFPILNFWEDTAPNEFDVTITNFYGEIEDRGRFSVLTVTHGCYILK